ncbi:hypothetical protein C4D60_Mb06t11340 [Musa balbisiana]|uniref:Uncharacterized protein n=1 Tax=Musa balbisiana TaxID=52838 RepID=A0A4S8IM94_MUSBA|nr:hypothetical protein C4D60_Mb06t11340 [Musa balbisiana]
MKHYIPSKLGDTFFLTLECERSRPSHLHSSSGSSILLTLTKTNIVGSDITGEDTVGTCGTTNGSAAGTPTDVLSERWKAQGAGGKSIAPNPYPFPVAGDP